LFDGENDQISAQASDQNRRPIFVVADLDGQNMASGKDADALQQITRALFDVAERPKHFASRCKNGWRIALFFQRSSPRFQQWI
jgi:hypothetical protein